MFTSESNANASLIQLASFSFFHVISLNSCLLSWSYTAHSTVSRLLVGCFQFYQRLTRLDLCYCACPRRVQKTQKLPKKTIQTWTARPFWDPTTRISTSIRTIWWSNFRCVSRSWYFSFCHSRPNCLPTHLLCSFQLSHQHSRSLRWPIISMRWKRMMARKHPMEVLNPAKNHVCQFIILLIFRKHSRSSFSPG